MYEDSQFWMVWNPAGNVPRVQHASFDKASLEAERLARANKGQRFYVLEAVSYCLTNDVSHVRLGKVDEEMPF